MIFGFRGTREFHCFDFRSMASFPKAVMAASRRKWTPRLRIRSISVYTSPYIVRSVLYEEVLLLDISRDSSGGKAKVTAINATFLSSLAYSAEDSTHKTKEGGSGVEYMSTMN
ncbi:hypothetical protein CRG98_003971 [Punica granatum]|uniref:Uncharacterized protein n=1 Tax=Punica granatum TaxID=22663 RepID=A0A2I0L4L1_PUNGR|nr:hypothetical protein CRG98_003971 [Punica granatum]